jgi:hypothetical protein
VTALEQIRIWHKNAERNMLADIDAPPGSDYFEGQVAAFANVISAIEAETAEPEVRDFLKRLEGKNG